MQQQRHINQAYDEDMKSLVIKLGRMFAHVENMLDEATDALQKMDIAKAKKTRKLDKEIDALDAEISEQIMDILARWNPVAIDLRLIISALRVASALERMGDYTSNICRRIVRIIENDKNDHPYETPILTKMFKQTREMIKLAGDGFLNNTSEECRHIIEMDDLLDQYHSNLLEELTTYMMEESKNVSVGVEMLMISKSLERIGDHATNVAEMIIYFLEATSFVSRHPVGEDDD